MPELYIGLMSGTSLDGVDAVLVDLTNTRPQLLSTAYLPFDAALKQALLALHTPSFNELHLSQLVSNQLAYLYAESVAALQIEDRTKVRAIGCHGQTVRHCPEHGYTLQLGNAALLAELTQMTVVSDFRSRDIAAGGQGAPLVPAFHDQLLRHPTQHRVIVNIGGISNLTNLAPHTPTTGFDCGPGNLLMDAWCFAHRNEAYDKNGAWAAQGNVLTTLLENLLTESFFALRPPKSSGRDLFHLHWLQAHLQGDERAVDVQATLLELTAITIVQDIRQYCAGATEIYLCGGGAHNHTLRTRIADLLPACQIATTEALGVNSDYLEAVAFAWLAQCNLWGKTANLPCVTGAQHARVLGSVQHSGRS